MTGLRELLDAATGGSDAMRVAAGTTAGSVTVTTERAQAREALRALAPELAALCLDMGDAGRGAVVSGVDMSRLRDWPTDQAGPPPARPRAFVTGHDGVSREAVEELRAMSHKLHHTPGRRGCPGAYAGCRKCRLLMLADELERTADTHEPRTPA